MILIARHLGRLFTCLEIDRRHAINSRALHANVPASLIKSAPVST